MATVSLTINDQKIEVEEGKSLLTSCEKLGIKIPTLCYHKPLSPYGACRLCLVEIEQASGESIIQTSCTYPAQNGLVVKTESEKVKKTRKIMIELLLARAPESEKIITLAKEYGVEKVRVKTKKDDCILCGLCVRMCQERMGRWAIGFTGRGPIRAVKSPFDKHGELCQVCGACEFICPTNKQIVSHVTDRQMKPIPSEFNESLVSRPAVYIPYPQAVPNKAVIDPNFCVRLKTGECGICKVICEADAIDYDQKEKKIELNVGAIVLTQGGKVFDANDKKEFGYGRYPNVISGIQFERILGASGPYSGRVLRPSDKKIPKKIAFLQCVGSRDVDHNYCSSVCCMYATKQAIIAKEHEHEIDITIFYIDLRAFSKGFEDYYKRAVELGVKYVRCRPSAIKEDPKTNNLKIKYQGEDRKIEEEEFDIAILSVGFKNNPTVKEFALKFGILLNEHNYCWTDPYESAMTNKDGIFTAGIFTEPKDIPETVMQASAASSKVLELLHSARGSLVKPKIFPEERDVTQEEPRIGVFVCHCGKNIGGVVNVPSVRDYAKTLPNVVFAEDNLYTCSTDSAKRIKEVIEKEKLNRVIVASCSPRTHEPLFQETLKESGLNPYLFEMANIRDQCSWAHMNECEKATEKSKDLVRMAVAKSRMLEPLYSKKVKINQCALILGGGIAGMSSALTLGKRGIKTYIIEKEKELGGNLKNIRYLLKAENPEKKLSSIIREISDNSNIQVYTNAKIKESSGSIGKFKTKFTADGKEIEIEHGIVIVATGAKEYKPIGEYLYGKDKRVFTQLEFENIISNDSAFINENIGKNKTYVMVQCVGSRNSERPYCNRVCCSHAVKNGLKIKELDQSAKVIVLYRDMRTYGFYESYYRQAREKGVLFIRFPENNNPTISNDKDNLRVLVHDTILGQNLEIRADYILLSTGPIPDKENNEEVNKLLKIPLSRDGFFLEKHIKLAPSEFSTQGVYLSGTSHYPKFCDEAIVNGQSSATKAYKNICNDERELEAKISTVIDENCDGCAYCVDPCPAMAIKLIEYTHDGVIKKTVEVNPALCEGCGVCMATCPKKGIYVKNFKPEQIMAMVDAALNKES